MAWQRLCIVQATHMNANNLIGAPFDFVSFGLI
jgi:hypothetical protein